MTEHETQSAIIDLINLRGGIAIRVNSGTIIVKDSKGNTRAIHGAPKGTSDIIGGIPRKGVLVFTAIECKQKPGKPTQEQIDFLDLVNSRGGIGIVAYSVDDAIELFEGQLPPAKSRW